MSIDKLEKNFKIALFNNSLDSQKSENQIETPLQNIEMIQPNILEKNSKISSKPQNEVNPSNLNKTKSIYLESEFPTENYTLFSNPKFFLENENNSSEKGLKFLLFQAMSSIEFRFIRKINVSNRYKETIELQKMLAKKVGYETNVEDIYFCLLYTSPSPRDLSTSRMPSSA